MEEPEERSGVTPLHMPPRVWKNWKMRGSRCCCFLQMRQVGEGGDRTEKRVQVGSVAWASLDVPKVGVSSSGLSVGLLGSKHKGGSSLNNPSVGLKLKGVVTDGGEPGDGPSSSKAKWWADTEVSPGLFGVNGLIRDCLSPSQPEFVDKSISKRPCSWARLVYDNGSNFEAKFFKLREEEDTRK